MATHPRVDSIHGWASTSRASIERSRSTVSPRDHVRSRRREPGTATDPDGSRPLTWTLAPAHQPGTRRESVHGLPLVSSIASRTCPRHGYALSIRRATAGPGAPAVTTRAPAYWWIWSPEASRVAR